MIMNRKSFLKKSILGFSLIGVSKMLPSYLDKNPKIKNLIGFNHLPNPKSQVMKNAVYHAANTRGGADHGWLKANHSFSFANYYNPERMQFGALRVLNDDYIIGGAGFGTHPHDNMEIITIPLEGDLEHKDSMGNVTVIQNGDIQVMSAGTGIQHSEYNKNKDQQVKFLQIWVFPNKKNVTPRYDQITLKLEDRHNKLQQIISPNPDDAGVWIHQNAWFHLGKFDKGVTKDYSIKGKGNGLYIFNLNGTLNVNNQILNTRDGFGIWDIEKVNLMAESDAEFLIMEVPMMI
jgi:redox-sensitive bicupin YhaK (pirin superfamily)